MRILQICKKFPYPLKDGETIAINQLTKAFHQLGTDTYVAALNTKKHYTDVSKLPPDFKSQARYNEVVIDTSPTLSLAARSLLTGTSFNIERFMSKEFSAMLIKLLTEQDFDIVQLEGLYLIYYIPVIRKYSKAKIVLRAHNVEHIIWRRLLEKEKGLSKILLGFLSRGLYKAENKIIREVDAIVPISAPDADWFKANNYKGPLHICPVGIDDPVEQIPERSNYAQVRFFHIGSMDWMPNMEGLNWFIHYVWKNFVTTHENAELHLAGRNFPKNAYHHLRNVFLHGEVDDAAKFMSENDVMVVPLKSGSGIRIKILEAMNLSKTVISTDIGKEGIPAADNNNILIANTAQEFVQKMELCINDRPLLKNIGAEASVLIRREFDTLAVGKQLLDFYSQL